MAGLQQSRRRSLRKTVVASLTNEGTKIAQGYAETCQKMRDQTKGLDKSGSVVCLGQVKNPSANQL